MLFRSPRINNITVRHLLNMTSGLKFNEVHSVVEKDWVRAILQSDCSFEPGTEFSYNSLNTYLLSAILCKKTGMGLVEYLTPRLFEPLGIVAPTWETDPLCNTFGAGGLFLTLSELHTFGQFYLQNGRWKDRQLLDAAWVKASTSKQVDNGAYGYGYLFWGGEQNTFRADGKYGQLSILCREKDAVITVVAECREGAALNRAIFDELYPQL